MKILMIHPHEVYSSVEPWTTRIINFGKEFVKKGHEVKIAYFPLDWKAKTVGFRREDIEFVPFCRRAGIYNIIKNCIGFSSLVEWSDIVHFQKCFHYASLPSVINGFLKDKPLHYDWDDWEEMIYYESADPPIKAVGLFLRTLERTLPSLVDTVSVSSEYLHNLCLKIGIKQNRIFYAPVGADLAKFNPGVCKDKIRSRYNIKDPLVMYIGQLHGGQYVKLFIGAAKRILDKGIRANFMVVGDGSQALELKQYAKNLRLDGNIIFTGAVANDEMPEYIAGCDIAIACFEDTPVTRCKSPLKIAEYLACGKAIIASSVGEVRKMVGDAGILVAPGRSEPIAEKIELLLRNRNLREELELKARKRAEEVYNWRASSENLLKAYDVALENKIKKPHSNFYIHSNNFLNSGVV